MVVGLARHFLEMAVGVVLDLVTAEEEHASSRLDLEVVVEQVLLKGEVEERKIVFVL